MRTFLHAIIIAATFAVAAPTQSIASTSIAEMTMSADECKARIVVNHALGFLRQKKRSNELFIDSGKDIPDQDAETPPNIDDIPADDVLEMIRELPDGYRMVFNLYIIEGRSHKEISQLLGIKADSSASQLHRAKAILAKKITEYKKRQAL